MCKKLHCCAISVFLVIYSIAVFPQAIDDKVLLIERELGIPGHPAPGNRAVSFRYPGNTDVTIIDIDNATGWYEVDDGAGNTSWIVKKYIASVVTATTPPAGTCYRVGAWNLEWFKYGKSRGFPEDMRGGATYAERTPEEIAAIATAIRDELDIKILALSEINGTDGNDGRSRSAELDTLTSYLGQSFEYEIAKSGRGQRVAIIYDRRFARLNAITEVNVPYTAVGGRDIFARDPLIAHFTFLYSGGAQNDLVMAALHLNS